MLLLTGSLVTPARSSNAFESTHLARDPFTLATGGAWTAVTARAWEGGGNPAVAGASDRVALAGSHLRWTEGLALESFGLGVPLPHGLGVSLEGAFLHAGTALPSFSAEGVALGTFSPSESDLSLHLSSPLGESWRLGLGARLRQLDGDGGDDALRIATGSIGLLYQQGTRRFGAALMDIDGKSSDYDVAMTPRIGVEQTVGAWGRSALTIDRTDAGWGLHLGWTIRGGSWGSLLLGAEARDYDDGLAATPSGGVQLRFDRLQVAYGVRAAAGLDLAHQVGFELVP